MPSGKARRIGGDWVESTDPVSGKVYYANLKTRETSWVIPEEVKTLQEKKAAANVKQMTAKKKSSVDSADEAENKWLERQDPKSGRMYYYNPVLKQTSWTRPDDTVTAASADPNFSKGAWVARIDPRSNRTYYYNTVAKTTSWTNPEEDKTKTVKEKSSTDKSSKASRMSKQIDKSPSADQALAYEAAPLAPTNVTSARQSIRLGAIATPAAAGSRMSIADVARAKKVELTGENHHAVAETPALADRFAKLRALRERANPEKVEEDDDERPRAIQIDIEDLAAQAMAEVMYNLEFKSYAHEFMNLKKKGFMGSKVRDINELVSWQTDKIKTSLHALSDPTLIHDSIVAFANIQLYMGDKSNKHPMKNLEKIFHITLQCPEEMRDEVYAQLIKQTTANPKAASCIKGWQMLVMCGGLFPPSFKLEKYLLSHLKTNGENEPYPGISRLAHYAMLRVQRSMDLGARLEVPTELEIEAVKDIKPVVLKINMLDGSSHAMETECWTTVADMCAAVANKLKIKDATPFGLFEINQNDEERSLENDNRVLDILSYWNREKKAHNNKRNPPSFQFVFKVKLFFDIKENDVNAIEVAYHQAVHDVTDSRYPCSEEDCFRLAALQAQERFGDCDGSDVFGDELQAFLPAKYYHEDAEQEIKETIKSTYALLKGYDRHETMNNYLDYVKTWKIYGCAYFFVEPQNQRAELPGTVVLAVGASGVLVVDPHTKDFLNEYPFSEVVTWGHSSSTFILVVGNLIRQNKLYFKTDQGNEINTLVHAYVQRLVEE